MTIKEGFLRFVGRHYFERPARKLTLREHERAIRDSGEALLERLRATQPTERSRKMLRHVIGIERWGQRRLRVFQGEPFVLDGHHPYKPPAEASWEQLLEDFAGTREETASLAAQLSDCTAVGTVPHNDFGELSARGWLRYLKGHAEVELRRLR